MQAPVSPEQFGGVLNYLPTPDGLSRERQVDLVRRTAALVGLELLILQNDDVVDGGAIDSFARRNSEPDEVPDFPPDCYWTLPEREARPTVFLARLPGGNEDLPLLGDRLHILYEAINDVSARTQ